MLTLDTFVCDSFAVLSQRPKILDWCLFDFDS